MQSLRFESIDRRRDRIANPEVGTTHWIWSNPSYVQWDREPSGILWIQGKPGSGKSVLAKSIQKHLSESEDSSIVSISARTIIGAWYYSTRHALCAHGMMLRSLLLQVLEQVRSLFRHVQEFIPEGQQWSRRRKILREILLRFSTSQGDSRRICCVVDGLDESDSGDEDLGSRAGMLRFLKRLVKPPSRFKFICLSRDSIDIEKILRDTHSIILQ